MKVGSIKRWDLRVGETWEGTSGVQCQGQRCVWGEGNVLGVAGEV